MNTKSNGNLTVLCIVRYAWWGIPFAFLAMALFRLPLSLHKGLSFFRLMGCGKNGTFDKTPDLHQWAIMGVYSPELAAGLQKEQNIDKLLQLAFGSFIAGWLRLLCPQRHAYLLQPIESHGLWNGKKVFGELPHQTDYNGRIAVMTRATIRLSKLGRFWEHVPNAAREMAAAAGFIKSYGVGEWPWVKQATFSMWESKEAMRNFAYKSQYHKEIVKKTHAEKWYSEDMFTRFTILQVVKSSA